VIAQDHELSRQAPAQGILDDEPETGVEFDSRQYVAGSLNLNPIETLVPPSSVEAVGDPEADVPNQQNEKDAQQSDDYPHGLLPQEYHAFFDCEKLHYWL
jgi:hypothetical protein